MPSEEVRCCLNYLGQVPELKKLVRWIYDVAPRIFTDDLVLATYIIVCSYHQRRYLYGSHNLLIAAILLDLGAKGYRSFKLMKVSIVQDFIVGFLLQGEPLVLHFLWTLTEVIIKIISDEESGLSNT